MSTAALGPFLLESHLGKGGFADVWRVRHQHRGTPAAVKVLLGDQAKNPDKLRSFLNEVRAVAQLDHPAIAWVLDYGQVSAEAETRTQGRLCANAPYLAMEYASGGNLRVLDEPLNWTELRAVVLSLLDALGHAHAHGLIHRDLKPDNVLLCTRADLRPGIKLTDFGIAVALEDATVRQEVFGTPHYMSPEQLAGDERAQGPWTDLYALGCLIWFLVTGRPVFHGKRGIQLIAAHRSFRPPRLEAHLELPDGFNGWLTSLLEKAPRARFQCAADAALALIQLGHPAGNDGDEPLRDGIARPVLQTRRDGFPLDWRRSAVARPFLELSGAGLNLFGLRPPAFTGRVQERDAIWAQLADVHRSRRSRGIVVRGDPGTGKSRLAQWMATRAAEVGAATVLSARFSQTNSALEDMLGRYFALHGLEGEAQIERLDRALHRYEIRDEKLRRQAHALLIERKLEGASRYASIRLLVEALAVKRPVVLVLDDLHTGIDGIRFARHVQNSQVVRPFPVLMLLVSGQMDDPVGPTARELDVLIQQPDISTLDLAPLAREPFMELVQNMLGLEPELARLVVDRTAGNPLFALQIVGDWVERSQLRQGSRGFKLRRGVRPQLPPDMKAIWVSRVQNVLEDLDPSAEMQLEAAAVLGMRVQLEEWATVCDGPHAVPRALGMWVETNENARSRRALVDRLRNAGLIDVQEDVFAFRQGEFRNAILDHARRHRRDRKHHRAIARMLGPTPPPALLERYGRHLLAAREREEALAPLLAAVPVVQSTVGRMSAYRLLNTIEHAMNRLALPPSDVRWGRLFIERATLADLLGRGPDASRWAAKAGREASRHGWSDVAAAANFRLGRHAMRRGDLDMANARLIRVTNQVDPEEHPFQVGEALFLLGTIARRSGETEEAERLLQAGRRWMLKDPDPSKQVRAFLHLARSALEVGKFGVGSVLVDRSLQLAIERGDLAQQVQCLSYAAEIARGAGRLEEASRKIRQAITVFELIGDAQLALLRCNLALVLLDLKQPAEALKELERALANAVEVDRQSLLLAVHCVRLRALAEVGLRDAFDECHVAIGELTRTTQVAEPDSARSAELAAASWVAAGDSTRAAAARTVAIDQYTKLHDEEAVARLST